jgi:4-hydroxybenzoate polyprenyltransferase
VSHPRRALLTAAALATAAAVSGREAREVGLVAATVLVGQAVLGWHNDLVDVERDRDGAATSADPPDRALKPLAVGSVRPADAWFALACAVLLLVPLSLTNSVVAGSWYLASVAVGLLGNVLFRRSWLSFLPWAVAFAAYPAFLSYGGWGGGAAGGPPQPTMVALAALGGIGVHVLGALPDLVVDNRVGYRHLPLRIALRTGATRLLVLAVLWSSAVTAGLVATAFAVGLRAS